MYKYRNINIHHRYFSAANHLIIKKKEKKKGGAVGGQPLNAGHCEKPRVQRFSQVCNHTTWGIPVNTIKLKWHIPKAYYTFIILCEYNCVFIHEAAFRLKHLPWDRNDLQNAEYACVCYFVLLFLWGQVSSHSGRWACLKRLFED